ncbi:MULTISPECIES: permease [Acinetobacter]|uniref:permease n=1 Tax=Acinetobacter TaxID=469 RepID=UPI0015D3B078|nr:MULTISPECIES: permease [Acinetobacter]MDM1261481.1 permease [Acinetobacter indicus]MDM1274084.1 permease [Acinetobacter indicus]MDM1300512.1 permease [Acinetobacter indicus]MDM1329495.1 permease [Acinetobacter indicus]MDM1337894.1 permease [Acinetobacter indicus]
MALLLPLISFLIGYFGVAYLKPLRPVLAMLLARLFIPLLIIYNMVFYQDGSLWLIGFSLISSILFFAVFYVLQKDKLIALCFSYLNGAWLGFPFALALFGPAASSIIVALYIGGSLFGNVCAVMAVSQTRQELKFIVKNVLLSPPVIALSLAGILSFWDVSQFEHQTWVQVIYQSNKVLVTFAGMCVLGMWLSKVRIGWADLKRSLGLLVARIPLALLLCAVAYWCLPIPQQTLIYAVMLMFFLLPPAANIVALETHYQGTGDSAKYIASGTIASAILIGVYGVVVHAVVPGL